MRMCKLCVFALLFVLSCSAMADKVRTWSFAGSKQQVFDATVRAVTANKWRLGLLDQKQWSLRFSRGTTSYSATLMAVRPGIVRVSIAAIPFQGYTASVSEDMAFELFRHIGQTLHPIATAPRQLSRNGRSAFGKYLLAQEHKAFAATKSGTFGYSTGQRFREEAITRAKMFCADGGCEVLWVDDLKVEK